MRIPNDAHRSRPWRIHELVGNFRLEDAWELPGAGRREDFGRRVDAIAAYDPSHSSSLPVRVLFGARRRLGERFGWDAPGQPVATLRDRLPADLRDGPAGPKFAALPFRSLYRCYDEWAAEISNRTVHAVLHLGWVPDTSGGYRAEMAVYVHPNGWLGSTYLAAIKPLRHLVVYPGMLRELAEPS